MKLRAAIIALTAFAACSFSARAGFIYHDTATTSGGEFNDSFSIGNLKNSGHGSPAALEDSSLVNQSYATSKGTKLPVTITLEFNTATNLDAFHLWNHSNKNNAAGTSAGVKDFTLTFYAGAGGTGGKIGEVFSGTASAAPVSGTYAAQTFNFASTYNKVRSAKLVILNRISGNGFAALREIGFTGSVGQTAAAAPVPAKSPEKVIVYLVGGQSNADGYGITKQLPAALQAPQPDIDFYHGNGGGLSPLPANQWIPLQPGSGSMKGNAGAFGPEINFGIGIHQALGSQTTRIAIIKHARGGSSLHTDWIAGGKAATTGDGPDYQAFQTTVKGALASLATRYPGAAIQIDGMIWHQGEADAASPASANAYKTNLTRFIADVRATFGKDLKFGIAQLSNNQTLLKPEPLATVKAAQAAVAAANEGNYLVATDDLSVAGAGKIHFGAAGNLAIGTRLADGMKQLRGTEHK